MEEASEHRRRPQERREEEQSEGKQLKRFSVVTGLLRAGRGRPETPRVSQGGREAVWASAGLESSAGTDAGTDVTSREPRRERSDV